MESSIKISSNVNSIIETKFQRSKSLRLTTLSIKNQGEGEGENEGNEENPKVLKRSSTKMITTPTKSSKSLSLTSIMKMDKQGDLHPNLLQTSSSSLGNLVHPNNQIDFNSASFKIEFEKLSKTPSIQEEESSDEL